MTRYWGASPTPEADERPVELGNAASRGMGTGLFGDPQSISRPPTLCDAAIALALASAIGLDPSTLTMT